MIVKTAYNLGDKVSFRNKHNWGVIANKVLIGEIWSIRIDRCMDNSSHNRDMYEIMAADGFFHWVAPDEIISLIESKKLQKRGSLK